MLQECIEALQIKEEGNYVDVTFGGGGHSRAILKKLVKGRLIAFDQDPDAWKNEIKDKRFILIKQNFKHMMNYLKDEQFLPVNGILADLGVSSHQLDDPSRGFSTRFNYSLDMRMSQSGSKSARAVLASYSMEQLQQMFSSYGEVRNAKTLARAIVQARSTNPINTVEDLKKILEAYVFGGNAAQYFAQVFQAIRIEVNDELEALKEFLIQSRDALVQGGRLVVMSYHSLEDRIVKDFINHGNFEGESEKDLYGNRLHIAFKAINRKPILPSDEEVKQNSRARSARLRVAERV